MSDVLFVFLVVLGLISALVVGLVIGYLLLIVFFGVRGFPKAAAWLLGLPVWVFEVLRNAFRRKSKNADNG